MKNYDYLEAMTEDILEVIKYDYIDFLSLDSLDDLEEKLNDDLWTNDSVTGNASGSYTFSRYEAKEYVTDNMDLCVEALKEFCVEPETIAEKFLREDWEYFDVTIRCYLLGQAISDALESLKDWIISTTN